MASDAHRDVASFLLFKVKHTRGSLVKYWRQRTAHQLRFSRCRLLDKTCLCTDMWEG